MNITVQGNLVVTADVLALGEQLNAVASAQAVQTTLLRTIMTKQEELEQKVTNLTNTVSNLNTTIPAYIAERDRIDAELRAATATAVSEGVAAALATDSVSDAANEAQAQALRDAAIDGIMAKVTQAQTAADSAMSSLTPPVVPPVGDVGNV